MTEQNEEPRSSQAPAEQGKRTEPNNPADIRDRDAYERSQSEKAARLAGKAQKETEALKSEIAELKTLLSGFVGELKAEKEARVATEKAAQRGQLVNEAATKFKIPAELSKRIQGETAEDIMADAEVLAKALGLSSEPPPQKPNAQQKPVVTGNGGTVSPEDAMRTAIREKMTAKPSPATNPMFDADVHRAKGGGIVTN